MINFSFLETDNSPVVLRHNRFDETSFARVIEPVDVPAKKERHNKKATPRATKPTQKDKKKLS